MYTIILFFPTPSNPNHHSNILKNIFDRPLIGNEIAGLTRGFWNLCPLCSKNIATNSDSKQATGMWQAVAAEETIATIAAKHSCAYGRQPRPGQAYKHWRDS